MKYIIRNMSAEMPCVLKCINLKQTLVEFPPFSDCEGCPIVGGEIKDLLNDESANLNGITIVENRVLKDGKLVGFALEGKFVIIKKLK